MNKFRIMVKTMFLASAFAVNAFAQDKDTAYVPFVVNVDAIATARLDGVNKFEETVRAGYTDTLRIIAEGGGPSLARPGKTPGPVTMYSSRGRISLELSRELYRNADIALYSLNGKQVLRGSGEHPNLAMGVYLLSVRGVNGSAFTARFAHSGGGLNVDVGFASGNSASLLEKPISGNWTITVSAEGYLDTSYAFFPETGKGNTPVQVINLRQPPSPEPLACTTLPASGYATQPITPPALTCRNGAAATGITWFGSPAINWSNPKDGTYSNVSVMADCGTDTNLMASCPGTLVVYPTISCSMAGIGYEGTAISQPAVVCSDGSVPFDIVYSGYQPNWDNPVPGNYGVLAEADCGHGPLPKISCGALTVEEVTLACGSVPASGYEGTGITQPTLTCSHGTLGTPSWTNAPDWSNPAPGTYSNISVTATCGKAAKTANCSGTLTVNPVTLTCGSVPASGSEALIITPPALSCSYGTRGTPAWVNAPDWSNPAPGTYSNISATATCGKATKTANCSGSLTVNPATLTCGSVPTSGFSGVAITPPALTCSRSSTLGTPTWTNAPDWSSPARGTYHNISATATCGVTAKTANCSGTLNVSCFGNDNTSTLYCSNGTMKTYGFVTYNGQTYKTVVIGTQTWMAENLNYNISTGNSDCYDNDPANCTKYGRLYDWATAMEVCPSGWHLPSDAEWTTLTDYVGVSSSTVGTKLKATSGWNAHAIYGNGTDEYGFSALPGGYGGSVGNFVNVGNYGYWWSAAGGNSYYAWYRYMYYDNSSVDRSNDDKSYLFSVRCLQD